MLSDEQQEVVARLMRHTRPIVNRYYTATNCVATCRVVRTVLAQHRIRAEVLPVSAVLFNQPAFTMAMEGTPLEEVAAASNPDPDVMAPHTLGLGIMAPNQNPADWVGHVVLRLPGGLLDLSIEQATRPHKQLIPQPVWEPIPDEWQPADMLVVTQPEAVIVYRAAEGVSRWRDSPNWAGGGPEQTVTRQRCLHDLLEAVNGDQPDDSATTDRQPAVRHPRSRRTR